MSWAMISVLYFQRAMRGKVSDIGSLPLSRCYESHVACACNWKLLADALRKLKLERNKIKTCPKLLGEVDGGSACFMIS